MKMHTWHACASEGTIENYRVNIGVSTQRNFGYLEGNVNSFDVSNIVDSQTGVKIFRSVATEVAEQEPKIFTALEVSWSRITDSEYRMLNKLALNLEPNAQLGAVFNNYIGTIKVVSERAYCTSCQGAIKQFNSVFPNIKLILIDAIKM
ncbi:deaminase domain-containing protein [Pedobacter sp. MR22-3]|uniref:deaminase domain-containing protein n=1 Tax=Pedobacter sp. MR22-3 TaxID=2994552 RepID=UPI0022454EDF|nr:deaminase domain-containing protein [Pedobacter sp. MR22-3]MCX2583772.1 hypothetical protein [Pedobacter sp. MR22-3]